MPAESTEKPKRLVKNAVKCLVCGDVIESKHRHDFVRCSCGETYVDGGLDYIRIGYHQEDMYEDLCEWEDDNG